MVFEVGKVFYQTGAADQQPEEEEMLAVLWAGRRRGGSWMAAAETCDFYDMKGVAEALLENLGVPGAVFTALADEECRYTIPGASARISHGERTLGILGELHPEVRGAYDLKQHTYILDLDVQPLETVRQADIAYRPVPRFPATDRDITLIIDAAVEAMSVVAAATSVDEPLLEHVDLFDVYTGDPIPNGKKSISVRMTYRSLETTLEDENVNRLHRRISEQLIAQFKAALPA
jgi:phenylalanyl-tRNA synthetase beta chain